MKQNSLTNSEKEIMDLLWTTDRPLTASEIVSLSPDRTWKKSYIHLLINSLLEKHMIKIADFVRTEKNYARSFVATLSAADYSILQLTSQKNFRPQSIPVLVSSLIDQIDDVQLLEQVEEIVKKKKEELN